MALEILLNSGSVLKLVTLGEAQTCLNMFDKNDHIKIKVTKDADEMKFRSMVNLLKENRDLNITMIE